MKKTKVKSGLKNQKAITLIALVITIIVMLILAGVSIAMLTGDNGILKQAQNAQDSAEIGEEKEQIRLAWNGARINTLGASITADNLKNSLKDNGIEATVTGTDKFTVTMPSGNVYTVENGKVLGENEQEKTIYTISFDNYSGGITADSSNPTTITEGSTVTLTYNLNTIYDGGVIFTGVDAVEGAEYEIITLNEDVITIKLKNPSNNVKISFGVTDDGCCFVAGTQVWMADGTTKNIEDIVIGDKVINYNEQTGEYQIDEVINTIINPNTTDMARLNLADGTNIEMNAYHPVYTQEGWKSLTEYEGLPLLTKSDKILSENGEFIEISNIERWEENEKITTYNLSIKSNNNFFVGITPILVHNAIQCPSNE